MKYLAVFLLVGLGFASAFPSDFDGALSIDRYENVDETPLHDVGGWIADQMKVALEKMIDGMERAIEQGKTISEEAFRKAEAMYNTLVDMGINVGEKIKEALERIREELDKNRPEQADDGIYEFEFEDEKIPLHVGGWIADQMRVALEKMIDGMERAIEQGKTISEEAFRKAEEMYNTLVNWGIDVGEKIKEALERIGEQFDKNRPERAVDHMNAGGWIADQMRVALEKMIDGMERAIEQGKTVSEEAFRKAEEMYNTLVNWGINVGEKIKEALERIKEKFDQNRLERAIDHTDDVQQGPILDRLREIFERLVERIKERSDNGEGISGRLMKRAVDIYELLKNFRVEIREKIQAIFEDLRSKMGQNSVQQGPVIDRLKESFENLVNKMKEAFESGSGIRGDFMKKAEDIYEKLKNLRVEISEKVKSIFEDLRAKFGRNSVQHGPILDRLREIFERLVERIKERSDGGSGISGRLMKRAEDIYEMLKNFRVEISEKIRTIFEDLRSKIGQNGVTSQDASISNLFENFRKLRELIKEKLDPEKLKAKVEELFGKGNEFAEQILEMLKTKGDKAKQKILDWIDRVLPDKEERSISEVYEKLREFFRDLQLDLKERFTKFGEWVKEQYEKGLEKGMTRAENIKKIAKEFIDDTRVIGKDMAEEALGFFREYKKDLGKLYDNVVDKIGKILKS